MTIKECYKILGVAPNADMEELKSAFRKQAFRLHPDLNPDPSAQQEFQKLNEAYVLLKETLEHELAPQKKKKQKKNFSQAQGKKQSKAEKHKNFQNSWKQHKSKAQQTHASETNRSSFSYKKEDVMNDILNDPFARQVFEDIYAHIKHDRSQAGTQFPQQTLKRHLEIRLGSKKINFDFSKNPLTRLKHWFKKQLDDEQTVYFSRHQLIPGRNMRLEIATRFAGSKKIELCIPTDFQIGKPIRLRGLGRKIGPFQGDMYLRIMGK